jgi:hypothetical protein
MAANNDLFDSNTVRALPTFVAPQPTRQRLARTKQSYQRKVLAVEIILCFPLIDIHRYVSSGWLGRTTSFTAIPR